MTKVRISSQFRNQPNLMAKLAQGGFQLSNEKELPGEIFEFDIHSPKIPPDAKYVDIVFDTVKNTIEVINYNTFGNTTSKITEFCHYIQDATQGMISATEALHGLHQMKIAPKPLYFNPNFAFWGSKRMFRAMKKPKEKRKPLFKRV